MALKGFGFQRLGFVPCLEPSTRPAAKTEQKAPKNKQNLKSDVRIFQNSYAISKIAKMLHKVQQVSIVHIVQVLPQNKNRAADGWNRRSPAKVHLKTKKQTDISQTQAGFKAKSRRNPLWIPRLFNAKSGCVCRNRLNFRLFRYTLIQVFSVSLCAARYCPGVMPVTFLNTRIREPLSR